MTIQSVTIKNFRSYYGENQFDFTDGLTLIIGDNGDGKTTFFEALRWLFDTTKENKSIEHMSEMRKVELELGEQDTVSVTINFDHDGDKSVEKSFVVEKVGDNKFSTRSFSFIGYETRNAERIQIPGGLLINRCFDAFIQRYSMFKGESNLNVFDDKDALKMLVDKLSDVHEFDVYETMSNNFKEKSEKAYEKECKNDKKTQKAAELLEKEKTENSQQIQNIKSEIKNLEISSSSFEQRIQVLEKNKETSERYQEIKKILEARQKKVTELTARVNSVDFNINLLDEHWILSPFAPILKEYKKKISKFNLERRKQHDAFIKEQGAQEERKKVLKELSSFANGAAQLPWYLPDQETMQEMIDDEICKVCGRPAPKGSDAYNFMCEKLESYRAHLQEKAKTEEERVEKKELFVNNYIQQLSNLSTYLSGEREREIVAMPEEVKDRIDLIERLKNDLEVAKAHVQETEDDKARLLIQAEGVTEEQLDVQFSDLKGFFEQKGKADNRLAELKVKRDYLLERQADINARFDSLDPSSGMAKIYQRVYVVLGRIAEAFRQAKETNLTNFLEHLEKQANSYMTRLNENDFHGIIRLIRTAESPMSIAIKLYSENSTEIKNPGGAQLTTMYMSILFAISDLTSSKREQAFPLIFDAPTSSFGSTKENVFYNIIDKIDKQCIIVTKDLLEEGKLNYNKINELTCSVYRIKKAEGFDENNLATIRTIVTKVK